MLVPWLQDFSLGRDYSLEDVHAQILAARDAKAGGFLLWNPTGIYTDGRPRRTLGAEPSSTEMPTDPLGMLWKMWKNELSANCGELIWKALRNPADRL